MGATTPYITFRNTAGQLVTVSGYCSNVHFAVTSAKRTPEQNKACNGAPNSQHLIGEAIDIKPCGSTTGRASFMSAYRSLYISYLLMF